MTRQVSNKDRDGLKALATELGLDFPNNMPTNKLVELIQGKIIEDKLDIELVNGKVDKPTEEEKVPVSKMAMGSRATEIVEESVTKNLELLPLDNLGKAEFVPEENFKHDGWVMLDGIIPKLKSGVEGTDHKLLVHYFVTSKPEESKKYDFEGKDKVAYVMIPKGDKLIFEITGTGKFMVTETQPDPEGEEGETIEVEVEKEQVIKANDYFDSAMLKMGYSIEVEVDVPEPEPEPEPESEFVNGINTIDGYQFEYDLEDGMAFTQISDNLLIAYKKYGKEVTEDQLFAQEGARLIGEHAFIEKLMEQAFDFMFHDARFNNVITKKQFEDLDFYHDVETL